MSDIMNFIPLWGSWNIDSLIGKGTYGAVYKAYKVEYGDKFFSAIKHIEIPGDSLNKSDLISEGFATDESSICQYYDLIRDKFLNEIKICYRLKGNTNIVSYEDHMVVPKPNGSGYDVFIRMEYLKPLTEYMATHQMSEHEVIRLGIDMCMALSVLEKTNIIHRDIKPGNIFINEHGVFKLGDFGESKVMSDANSHMSVRGTYSFMAPEIIAGGVADKTVDIYSLGMVLYKILNNNRQPFCSSNGVLTADEIQLSTTRRLSGESLPKPAKCKNDALAFAILKACSFEASKRFRSSDEFAKALEKALVSLDTTLISQEYNDDSDKTIGVFPGVTNQRKSNQANYNMQGPLLGATEYSNDNPYLSSQHYKNKTQAKKSKAIISICVALLVMVVGIIAFISNNSNNPDIDTDKKSNESISTEYVSSNTRNYISVPSYINKKYEDASEDITSRNLIPVIEYEYNDNVDKDLVISQDISPGTELEVGDKITIIVSLGEEECPYDYEQKITVKAKKGESSARLKLYVWEKGEWREQYSCKAVVGKEGIGLNYGEGSTQTPQGTFKLGTVLAYNQIKTSMPVTYVTTETCVVDDPSSHYYNIIMNTYEVPNGTSYDPIGATIAKGANNACIYIQHNGSGFSSEDVVPGKGSVITICGMNKSLSATMGCIDIAASDMSALLKLLDYSKLPHIEIATE